MTPYERGYIDTMEKLAAGMFPTVKKLVQMGVKPGSGFNLLPYIKGAPTGAKGLITSTRKLQVPGAGQVTPVGKQLSPEELLANTAVQYIPVGKPTLPHRLMPDIRDLIRQRARDAGTYTGL